MRRPFWKTAYWLTDIYFLYLFRDNQNPSSKLTIDLGRLKEPDENAQSLEIACRRFGNRLLDQEVRQVVQTETAGLRDALVQKAFFMKDGHVVNGIIDAK